MSATPKDEEASFANVIVDLFFQPEGCRLEVVDGILKILGWRSEADLRRQLARLAWIYGWGVRQEVVVPGWGRIDIVLDDPDQPKRPILIELKLDLKRPSDARKAFQQADGYGRWWKTTKDEHADVVLTAAEHDPAVVTPVEEAYPEVSFYPAAHVMGLLPHWRNPTSKRWMRARARLLDAQRALAVHEYAVAAIERIENPT